MKHQKWIKYLITLILIVVLLGTGIYLLNIYTDYLQHNYELSFVYISFIYVFCFGLIGIVLGGEQFLINHRKAGHWKLNKTRTLVLTLPALFCALGYAWLYIGLYNVWVANFLVQSEVLVVSSLVFGYSLITSFERY